MISRWPDQRSNIERVVGSATKTSCAGDNQRDCSRSESAPAPGRSFARFRNVRATSSSGSAPDGRLEGSGSTVYPELVRGRYLRPSISCRTGTKLSDEAPLEYREERIRHACGGKPKAYRTRTIIVTSSAGPSRMAHGAAQHPSPGRQQRQAPPARPRRAPRCEGNGAQTRNIEPSIIEAIDQPWRRTTS